MIAPSNTGYLLLFRSNDWHLDLSREELQKAINQNRAWIEQLAAQGKVRAAQPLARNGGRVSGRNGRIVSDGPFAEAKEVVGGYFLLDAGTMEEAITVAQSCPSLAQGASIEVRPLTDECPLSAREGELARAEQLAAA